MEFIFWEMVFQSRHTTICKRNPCVCVHNFWSSAVFFFYLRFADIMHNTVSIWQSAMVNWCVFIVNPLLTSHTHQQLYIDLIYAVKLNFIQCGFYALRNSKYALVVSAFCFIESIILRYWSHITHMIFYNKQN